jgi:hypothetical protein
MALDIMSTNRSAVVVFRKICDLFDTTLRDFGLNNPEMISRWEMAAALFGRRISTLCGPLKPIRAPEVVITVIMSTSPETKIRIEGKGNVIPSPISLPDVEVSFSSNEELS